MKNDLVILR